MSSNLTPLGDRVIVAPIEHKQVTLSGIYLPDTAKEKPQEGNVIAVGAGKRNDDGSRQALDVSVGDRVVYAKYAGTEFKINGSEKVLIMKESDIMGIMES